MAGPRQLVAPPTFVDRNFGLLSVVQARYDEPDSHWRNGVTFQDICGIANLTHDSCAVSGAPPPKAGNVTVETFGALPFTVFAEVDCSPVGYTQQEQRARAVDALTRAEGYQVERALWTGDISNGVLYPHLAANTLVTDPTNVNVTLQCAATTVSGSVVFDIVEGVARLEAAMSACWPGQFVIHVPMILGEHLMSEWVAEVSGAQIKTRAGNLVALGAGYPGTGPDGSSIANAAWIYATPPLFAYRSAPETFNFREQFDRSDNTLKTIVERTYVLGFPCCCFYAVPISVGGIVTGQPLSAF